MLKTTLFTTLAAAAISLPALMAPALVTPAAAQANLNISIGAPPPAPVPVTITQTAPLVVRNRRPVTIARFVPASDCATFSMFS